MRVGATLAKISNTPADSGISVTVERGDTLSAIAARHHVPLKLLLNANPQIINPDRICPGDIVAVLGLSMERLIFEVLREDKIDYQKMFGL